MKFHNLQKLKPGMLVKLERIQVRNPAPNEKVFGTENLAVRIKSGNPCNEISLQDYVAVPSPSVAIFLQHSEPLTNIADFLRMPRFIQVIVEDRTLWFETPLVYNLNQKQEYYMDPYYG
ncbi:MAG: hypothetical protein WC761_00105 [Candidatus Paceibacterota bacterium]|jgi:hypothetical protein